MGALDIPESYRDLFFYVSAVFVNVSIFTISMIAYLQEDVDYTKTGLYLIPGILSAATLLFHAFEYNKIRIEPLENESGFKKLIRSMSTMASVVVGSVLLGKYILSQDAKEIETVLAICLLSIAVVGDLYNERENTVDGKSWEVKVSKYAPAIQFGYFLAGGVFVLNLVWMKDFRQFASSNVEMWVFAGVTLLIILFKMRLLHPLFKLERENILLKQFLNIILLFSFSMVYSLAGKLHKDEGDVLAENSKERNSLMIVSQVGLWIILIVTTINKINIGKNEYALPEISVEKESEFVTLQF